MAADDQIPNETIEEAWAGILAHLPNLQESTIAKEHARYAFYAGSYSTLMRLKKQLHTGDLRLVLEQIADTEAEFREFVQHHTPH